MTTTSAPHPSAPHRNNHTAHRGQLALIAAATGAVILAAIGIALLAHGGRSASSGTQGSGVTATQTRTVARFTSLDLAGSNEVTVVLGVRQSVVVHADSNLLSHVTTKVIAGTLVIADTGSFTTRTPMSVEVSAPSLTALNLSGSGQLSVTGINAPRLTMTVSGSGLLNAAGTATRLDITVSGDGMAGLNQLTASEVHAVVSGSGLIRVTATKSLDAAVSGTGAIVYSGNPPRVTSSVTGTGTVTPG
jgi:Putative auto-transporter adhesin, head GIN domain